KTDDIVEDWLLKADVIPAAFLRLQVRITEKVEGRKIDKELAQGRRLETGAIAALQHSFGPRNVKAWREAVGRTASELTIGVVANVRGQKKSVIVTRQQLHVAGIVGIAGEGWRGE